MPTTDETKKVRERALELLAAGPLTGPEIVSKIYPKAKHESLDPDYSRTTRQLLLLSQEGKIKRTGSSRTAPWALRTKPHVSDLPDAQPVKRTYTKRVENGSSAGSDLRAYLIRDIRMKLDELERLA